MLKKAFPAVRGRRLCLAGTDRLVSKRGLLYEGERKVSFVKKSVKIKL
jgi:hypothetical protein